MTDWQKHYETGDTPWDKGGPAPPLVQWLERNRMHGTVLVPGCGHGNDLAALAGSGADAVTGLDIAAGAVTAARERTAELENVSVILGDLFTLADTDLRGQFDWVFEHTCYCAINPCQREAYAAAVAAALKPGGHLLAVFYLHPWQADEDQSKGPPFGTEIAELDQRFSPHFSLLESYVPDVSYAGREGRELLRLLKRR